MFLLSDWQIINRLLCVTRAFSTTTTTFQSDKRGSKTTFESSPENFAHNASRAPKTKKPRSYATPQHQNRPNDAPLNRAPLPHCFGLWYSTRNNLCPSRCPHALGQTAYQRLRCRLHKCLQHPPYRLLQLRLRGARLLKQMHRLPRQSANYHDGKLCRHECLRQYIDRAILSRPRCPYTLLQRS